MKALIDLNVFLDVAQQRAPHFPASAAVLSAALSQRFEAWMAAHSLTTLHYLIERHRNLATADAAIDWHLLHFRIATLDHRVFQRARSLGLFDFEDSVVAASGESSGCGWIITRNEQDFVGSPVPAVSPSSFLEILNAGDGEPTSAGPRR